MQLVIYQNGCKAIGFSNGKGQSAKINSVKLKEFRDLKELYLQFNARNGGNPSQAQIELEKLIETYRKSRHEIFREFASLLEKYKSSIINSFIMVEKIGNGRIYDSRLSNGPIESINRKIKDLKRLGRGFRNFEHFRNRFLYATRSVPVLNGITDYNPVLYLEEANSLYHGNWIEIERQYKYIQTLQKILSENDIPYPNEYDF